MAENKIRILETIRQGKIGGGETHVLELCTNIDKEIYEPIVLSFTDGPMVDLLKTRGIKTKVIKCETGFNIKVWKKVKQFLEEEKIDIVHAHGTRAMSNVFWAASRLKLPLIYTVHGWSFHPNQKRIIRFIRETSEKFLTAQALLTICVSKSNQNDGIKLFNLKRSKVIYNSVDLNKFNPNNNFKDIRKELQIPSNKTLIGYIVRITTQKDPFTMIKAMKIISSITDDVILLMVGDGELKNESLELIRKLNLEKNIVFENFRTDIPDILNAIDIYCLPSLWEGFPIGILESMAMKKCVICTPVDGNIELVINNETGVLVNIKQPEELANAILSLHNDKISREKLAEKGYDLITKSFGMSTLIKKIEYVYMQVINKEINK